MLFFCRAQFSGAPGQMRGFFAALRMTSKNRSRFPSGMTNKKATAEVGVLSSAQDAAGVGFGAILCRAYSPLLSWWVGTFGLVLQL